MEKYVIYDKSTMQVYAFASESEKENTFIRAIERAQEAIRTWTSHLEKYPENDLFIDYLNTEKNRQYTISTYDDFLVTEREYYLSRPLHVISEEEFEEMLNALPPTKWINNSAISMFIMSERYSGPYSSQYCHDRRNNKYYSKLVDITDRTTWIDKII